MFPDISYLDWIHGRPEQAEFDLGSSDLRRAPQGFDGVIPPGLADDSQARDYPSSSQTESTDETERTGGSVEGETTKRSDESKMTVKAHLAAVYGVEIENVLLTAGATHANFLAVAATLSEAESSTRVLVEKPGYEPLIQTPKGVGATVDRFRRPRKDGYPLDFERIDGALVENTAMVTVTNRHNPSGYRVGRDELAEVARVVSDGNARLLVDEVYAPFDSDGQDTPDAPFGGPTAAGLPNAVVTNSLTKFLGFGGLRIGWLVADAPFVSRARSVKHHVPAVAEPSRRLAGRALTRAPELAAASRERIRTNSEALRRFVDDRQDLSGRVQPGCSYAFLEHESADGNEVTAAAWDRGVLVVPGRFFDDSVRFRITASRKPETIRSGLDRFGDVLDSLGA